MGIFKYKKKWYSVDVKFEDFKKLYKNITLAEFNKLIGKKNELQKDKKADNRKSKDIESKVEKGYGSLQK